MKRILIILSILIVVAINNNAQKFPPGKMLPHEYLAGFNKMETKVCFRCKIEKPKIEFNKNKLKRDGREHICLACRRLATRKNIEIIKDIDGEVWRSVTIDNNIYYDYMVSNFGRVKSLSRTVIRGSRDYFKSDILKKQSRKDDGYLLVCLVLNKKNKTMLVHRLVAFAFIANPENKPEVNHVNGIKEDNNITNLEWNTPKENGSHASKNGLYHPAKGERSGMSKLTINDVVNIRKEHIPNKKGALKELSIKYNISKINILNVVRRRTWKHVA